MGLEVIRPIFPREVARYSSLLHLSPSQDAYLQHGYERYVETCATIERKFQPEFAALREELTPELLDTPLFIGAYARWRDVEERFCREIIINDHGLLEFISSVLAEPQRELMERVRLHRERSRCVTSRYAILGAGIDLSDVIDRAAPPFDISPELDQMLFEYERKVTPALVAWNRAYSDNRLELSRLMATIALSGGDSPGDRAGALERSAAATDRKDAIHRAGGLTQRQIAEINDDFAAKLQSLLPPVQAARLNATFLALKYPRVYPDRTDPTLVVESVKAALEKYAPQTAALDIEWSNHLQSYTAVCAALVEQNRRWQEQRAFTGSSSGWTEHEQRMNALLKKRVEIDEKCVRTIIVLVPEAARLSLQDQLGQFDERVIAAKKSLSEPAKHIDPR